MANHKSAKIRIKRNEAQQAVNASYLSKVRTLVKKVEAAVLRTDKKEAEAKMNELKNDPNYSDKTLTVLEDFDDHVFGEWYGEEFAGSNIITPHMGTNTSDYWGAIVNKDPNDPINPRDWKAGDKYDKNGNRIPEEGSYEEYQTSEDYRRC